MVIDFKSMEETAIKNFYGGEKDTVARMFTDGNNRIMCGRLAPGASIGAHPHETSSEIIYILSGAGRARYDAEWETVSSGMCHYCPKGHVHSLVNDGETDLVFFAVVPQQ